jgi:hypothetical protein
LKLGGNTEGKATESASGKLGEAAFAKANMIWVKLNPLIETKLAAKEAAIDVANSPDDKDSQAALRVQLKKILEQDEKLFTEIAQILHNNSHDGFSGAAIFQNVEGDRNQIIGQVTGGKVIGNITGNVEL